MAYEQRTWVSGETPLSAENMNHIEQGISDLDMRIKKMPTHTIKTVELSTIEIGRCPSTTQELISATFPTGYNYTNTYVLGVRVVRNASSIVYIDDGQAGVTYVDGDKICFVPSTIGATYCAGNYVTALICKVT